MKNVYVLPTNTSVNPTVPEENEYFDEGWVVYVLFKVDGSRSRPTRAVTSYGELSDVGLDSVVTVCHDQNSRPLGRYRVIGIVDVANGYSIGWVPDRKLTHQVVK